MATSGIPDSTSPYDSYRHEQTDLLKKIAGLLAALVALVLISVILQVAGLVGANRTADEVSDRLDDIRTNTATP